MGSRIIQDIQALGQFNTTIGDVVMSLLVSFVCGLAVSLVYRWTYRGASYSPSLVRSMITLAMITAMIMLVIGNKTISRIESVVAAAAILVRLPVFSSIHW